MALSVQMECSIKVSNLSPKNCWEPNANPLQSLLYCSLDHCLLWLVCKRIWLLDQDWCICAVFSAGWFLWCWHFRLALSGCACFLLIVILLEWDVWSAPKNCDKVSGDVFCKVTGSWHALLRQLAIVHCSKWLNFKVSYLGYPQSNVLTDWVKGTKDRQQKQMGRQRSIVF